MIYDTCFTFTAAVQKLNDLAARLAIGGGDEDYLRRLTDAAQQAALAAREVYTEAHPADSRWFGEGAGRARVPVEGYAIAVKNDAVEIRLPLRLSKRSTDSAFVCEPLDALLARHASALPRYRECTVQFLHCYAASHRPADVRDHDNLETRAVLNVIERYLLTSDSGIYCSNIHTSCWGERDETVITIRPGKIPIHAGRVAHANIPE